MNQGRDISSRRRTVGLVLDAIDIVLRRLERLHPSPDVDAIRVTALHQLREAQAWERAWPPLEEQERVMKRVLDLQASTVKLATPSPIGAFRSR
jgi:hypothetical protein